MIFGKIEYLNLLPFHVFIKRFTRNTQQKMLMEYKKNVPAKINNEFLNRRVDAAFISSIAAQKSNYVSLGIIAKQEVKSVIVIPAKTDKKDVESASSNLLANLLHVKGEVLIGDKALKHYIQKKPFIDLAHEWNKRYQLPFVFAVLCYHKDKKLYSNIEKEFLKRKVKIPNYILHQASCRTDIPNKEILNYLTYISYQLDTKAYLGLKKFYNKVRF